MTQQYHMWVQPCVFGAAQPLVLHSGSSCTHPFSYYTMHATVVYPFWAACPPDRRLCSKPYKPIDHPTNFVPERSLAFRVGPPQCRPLYFCELLVWRFTWSHAGGRSRATTHSRDSGHARGAS